MLCFQKFPFATHADLLDLFHPKEPVYDKELVIDKKNSFKEREKQKKEKKVSL